MNDGLLDAFRHSAWATRNLIQFCRRLTPEQLSTPVSGAYGSILDTLKHLLGAEAYYRFLFTGDFPGWDWVDDAPPTLAQAESWAAYLTVFWEGLLSRPIDVNAALS